MISLSNIITEECIVLRGHLRGQLTLREMTWESFPESREVKERME